jgi:glycosyltransferase involved in cell wall biosynthesis
VEIALVGSGVVPIPPLRYGSISRAIWELAEALRSEGHSVRILNTVRRGVQNDQFAFAAELDRLLGSTPTDVIHAHLGVPAFRLRMLGLPYVYTTHNPAWFFPDRSLYRWVFWFDRWATLRAATTLTETPLVAEAVQRFGGGRGRGPVRVIPHGISLERFWPAPGPGDGHVAVGIGAIRRVKRWDLAGRALRDTGVGLRVIGPIQDPEYAEEVRRSGPVELLGELSSEELVAEVHRAGFVVHPSESETFGLSVGEAAACGRPVVASSTVRSIVEDQSTGFLAPPETAGVDALVDFFRTRSLMLSQDEGLRGRMGRAGRRLAEDQFAWPKVAAAHVAIYREVLARTGPASPR